MMSTMCDCIASVTSPEGGNHDLQLAVAINIAEHRILQGGSTGSPRSAASAGAETALA